MMVSQPGQSHQAQFTKRQSKEFNKKNYRPISSSHAGSCGIGLTVYTLWDIKKCGSKLSATTFANTDRFR